MTVYQIKYQTRSKEGLSIPQGEWQDKEEFIVAGDDAREAVDEVVRTIRNHDFRLIEVKSSGCVHRIAHGIK